MYARARSSSFATLLEGVAQHNNSTSAMDTDDCDTVLEFALAMSATYTSLPKGLKCPLSGKRLWEPVQTPHGNTYERASIVRALEKKPEDPIASYPLQVTQLQRNHFAEKLLDEYDERRQERFTMRALALLACGSTDQAEWFDHAKGLVALVKAFVKLHDDVNDDDGDNLVQRFSASLKAKLISNAHKMLLEATTYADETLADDISDDRTMRFGGNCASLMFDVMSVKFLPSETEFRDTMRGRFRNMLSALRDNEKRIERALKSMLCAVRANATAFGALGLPLVLDVVKKHTASLDHCCRCDGAFYRDLRTDWRRLELATEVLSAATRNVVDGSLDDFVRHFVELEGNDVLFAVLQLEADNVCDPWNATLNACRVLTHTVRHEPPDQTLDQQQSKIKQRLCMLVKLMFKRTGNTRVWFEQNGSLDHARELLLAMTSRLEEVEGEDSLSRFLVDTAKLFVDSNVVNSTPLAWAVAAGMLAFATKRASNKTSLLEAGALDVVSAMSSLRETNDACQVAKQNMQTTCVQLFSVLRA